MAYSSNGSVDRFAADFEQHCEGARPALLGSVRFNSSLPPIVTISVHDTTLLEGNSGTTAAVFAVTFSAPRSEPVTVDFSTAPGSAGAGTDFTATAGTLTFPAGATTRTVAVPVAGDAADEPSETFALEVSALASGGVDARGTATIVNDDVRAQILSPGAPDGTFEAGDPWPAWTTQTSTQFETPLCDSRCGTGQGTAGPYEGGNWAWFGGTAQTPETATLGQSLALPSVADLLLRFQLRIEAVTAPATDTLSVSVDGNVLATFGEPTAQEANYTTREVDVSRFADGAVHSLLFTYSHPDPGVASFNLDKVELVSNPPPLASIDDRSVAEGSAVNAAFRLSLSRPSSRSVTVGYSTSPLTARDDADFTPRSGMVTFTPGRTSHSVLVPILTDTVAEDTEGFFVTLANASGAVLGRVRALGLIGDPPASQNAPMYRSYNKSTDYHSFTTDLASKNFAVGVLGFQDESNPPPFYVSNLLLSGTVPLFRMYNPNLGRHFYTASTGSRDFLMGIGAVYEKEEGFVYPLGTSPQPAGTTELFLLYNNNSGTHLFTADPAQKDGILSLFTGVWVQHTSVGFVFTGP